MLFNAAGIYYMIKCDAMGYVSNAAGPPRYGYDTSGTSVYPMAVKEPLRMTTTIDTYLLRP